MAYTDILGRIADDPGMFQSQQLWLRNAIEKARAGDPSGIAGARERLPGPVRERPTAGPAVDLRLRSHEIEAVEVHHLVPGGHEVVHEPLPGVLGAVDFGESPGAASSSRR